MQKLKSSDSDSSLFKKKEELAISNESKEYSTKPMLNLYIKSNNKSMYNMDSILFLIFLAVQIIVLDFPPEAGPSYTISRCRVISFLLDIFI